MRYLHLVYIFMALIASLSWQISSKGKRLALAVFLVVINGSMFAAQRLQYSSSEHLELPGLASANPWLQAFRDLPDTPTDPICPRPEYLAAPEEDYTASRAGRAHQLADTSRTPQWQRWFRVG